jgi:molybdenum cofactor cytidylyltransferase
MTTSCGIIILAAGGSSRMGKPKQLLFYKGHSLLEHCINTAMEADTNHIVLVAGAYPDQVKKIADGLPVHLTENIHWETGIASSIRCGIMAMLESQPGIAQIILMTADQPFLTSHILQALINTAKEKEDAIVACSYADTIGTPVLFQQKYLSKLLELRGDEGAKKLLKKYPGQLYTILFPKGEIDIDTMEDYENLIAK